MSTQVPIAPHALTATTMPATGTTIGYTGPAYYGTEYAEHGYISGALRVDEHTRGNAPGFYATTRDPMFGEQHEVFVMVNDSGSQMLHGYVA